LGAAVPIYELITRQGVFTPEEVTMLANVFEDVLRTLGLVDRKVSRDNLDENGGGDQSLKRRPVAKS
jgi:hypothetical protein